MKIGIVEYINTIRIQNACSMIQNGYTSINDIAFCCGYKDSQYFSKVFKSKLNTSPKKYISEFCEEIGISVSGLYNMFTKQVIREGKIPFEIGVERPNRKTIKAMKE